jgi:hypothetical protein
MNHDLKVNLYKIGFTCYQCRPFTDISKINIQYVDLVFACRKLDNVKF